MLQSQKRFLLAQYDNMPLFVPVSKIPKKIYKHILKKIAGNVDNGPRKTAITWVDVLDSRGNLIFDLPKTICYDQSHGGG